LRTLAFALIATTLPNLALAVPSSPYLGEDALTFPNGRSLPARRTEVGVPPRSQAAWAELQAHLGATWRADFDVVTGVPHQIYGGFLDAPGAIASAEAAQAYALEVFARHGALLAPGAAVSDFVVASNDLTDGLRTVGFVQHHQGLLVEGGQLSFRFKKDRLFMIVSEAWPKVQVNLPKVLLAKEAAVAKAQAWLRSVHGQEGELRDFRGPLILAQTPEGPAVAFVATLRTRQPIGQFDVYVDAESGRPLARRQTLMFADGTILVDSPERYPASTRIQHPGDGLWVTINGVQALADPNGRVTWTGNDTGSAVLTAEGPLVMVVNAAGTSTSVTVPIAPGGSVLWSAANEEHVDAQLVAFVASQDVKHYTKIIAPQMRWLDTNQLLATVNLSEEACNAFSDGVTINFYQAGNGCENMARIPDVVYHEFGHAFHFHAILRGVGSFDSSLSEGAADFLSAVMTGDPGMARGVFGDERPLRHIDPAGGEYRWPENISRDPHGTGLIFAGAMWDLRKALIELLGEGPGATLTNRLYYAALARSRDIPSSYAEVLAADDDDGDLGNGTPHLCLINAAFEPHGLVSSTLAGSGVKKPELIGFQLEVPVERQNTCPGTEVASMVVTWEVRGQPGSGGRLNLTPGEGTRWIASIPTQPAGTVLRYKLEIVLGSGDRTVYPNNAADPMYEVYVGEVTPIYCTGFEDVAFGQGWGANASTGSNEWEIGAPVGVAGSGDPSAAYAGDKVVGTDLGNVEESNGRYGRLTETQLNSPTIDTTGFAQVRLQYRRWLTVEDGLGDQATIVANNGLAWSNYASTETSTVHHIDREWRFQDVDLTPFVANSQVEVSFRLSTNERRSYGGWTIDEFCVVGVNMACGNNVVEVGEACDDGNDTNGDGCEQGCVLTPAPICGNGIVELGEACDDANQANGDGCEATCTATPPPPLAVCGNGAVETGEACDDGIFDGSRCAPGCVLPTVDPGLAQLDEESGCGCSTGRRSPGAPWALALLVFGLAFRRRR
jgi:MYXO-CTERM domain-containing protein